MAQPPEKSAESRQPRGARKRLQVLEAVLRVIAARGAGALTYRAVAEEAGVSLGVTTYYFSSRREMLAAAFELHLGQVRERGTAFEAEAAPAWQDGSLSLDTVTDGIVAFLEAMAREDRASVIASHELTLELTRDATLTRDVDASLAAHHRNMARLVGPLAGTTAAEGAAADEDAAIVSAVFDNLTLGWVARPGDAAYAARVRRIVRRVVEKVF